MADACSEAVKIALDWRASPGSRNAATAYLDALKCGDVRVLGGLALDITKQDRPLEVRHYGLKLLQHLIRIRWDELNALEKQNIGSTVVGMVQSFAQPYEPWSIRNQTAGLAAEVARREGPNAWKELLQNLFATSDLSPTHAEMAAMVLRWLPEDVIVHNDDLEAERRRALLAGLSQNLGETLPFMYKLLDKHYTSAMQHSQMKDMEQAKQHAAVVTAGLNALLAYAEWAPVTMFSSCGIIEACGFLLSSIEFRQTACEILKQLVSRKKPDDDTGSLFNSAMIRIFDILCDVSEINFQHQSSGMSNSLEFSECLCDTLVSFGLHNLQSIINDDHKLLTYFKQMLAFLQHPKPSLHAQSLPMWLAVVRDSSLSGEKAKASAKPLPREIASVLLNVVSRKLSPETAAKDEAEEESVSTNDYSQYRGRLVELIRSISCCHPTLAVSLLVQRLDASLTMHPTADVQQRLCSLEGTHALLELVVAGVAMNPSFAQNGELGSVMQGVLQRLLAAEWTEPALIEMHARCFDALGPYLKHAPAAVPIVIQALFKLLASVPVSVGTGSLDGKVRLQICTSFLRMAKAASSAFLTHVQAIAETMISLQQKGQLLRGEHILMGEALLIAASAAGPDQQAQVLEWLLGPFRERWVQVQWQQEGLTDAGRFVELLSREVTDVEKLVDKGIWYCYHSVNLFEKALRRCGRPSEGNGGHPMAVNMPWILPPLLRLLRCLHALWSPPVMGSLPSTIRAALGLGSLEQAAIFGENTTRSAPSASLSTKEEELRNWLKGIRDSGYNILGFASARIGEEFFHIAEPLVPEVTTGLVENISAMEFRHLRLMIHSVVTPFVKACPRSQWNRWLGPLLPPVLLTCVARLSTAWDSLVKEGAAKTSTLFAGNSGASGLKTEVIEERILRELSREVCNLLAVLGSSDLNQANQQGMLLFLMQYGDAASSALQLGIRALQWPDTDGVHKAVAFCGAVTNLASTLNDSQLHELVGRDMFMSVIQSLTCDSNASQQAELLGLLREIVVGLSPHTTIPKQMLMSLPSVTPQEFAVFEAAFAKTSSVKEQRQHLRSLLLAVGGDHLRALKPQKINVITNIGSSIAERKKNDVEEPGQIGLATML